MGKYKNYGLRHKETNEIRFLIGTDVIELDKTNLTIVLGATNKPPKLGDGISNVTPSSGWQVKTRIRVNLSIWEATKL